MNPLILNLLILIQLASCSPTTHKYDLSSIDTGQEYFNDVVSTRGINDPYLVKEKPSFLKSLSPRSLSPTPPSKSRSSSFSSQTSEQGPLRQSLSRLTSALRSSTRSTSQSTDENGPRSASAESKPGFLNYFLDFTEVDAISWGSFEPTWTAISLNQDQKGFIQQYAEDCDQHEIDFIAKVYKTLKYLEKSYPINHFILNLAVFMVNSYDNKGPKAAKLFLDSRFAFMRDYKWSHEKLLTKLKPHMKYSRHWATLCEDSHFNNNVQSLFMDLLHKKSQFHPMMMIYMQIFNGPNDANRFVERYARFLKTLIRLAVSDRHFEGPINVNHLTSIMIFANEELSNAIDAEF